MRPRLGSLIAGVVAVSISAHGQTITTKTVDTGTGGKTGFNPSAWVVSGNPAVTYSNADGRLMFARNTAADGSGAWTITVVDNGPDTGLFPSLRVIGTTPKPAICYYDNANGRLKFARNSATDGSGAWTITTIDSAVQAPGYQLLTGPSLAIVANNPAVSYYDHINGDLKFARNSAADGSGAWTTTTVDSENSAGAACSLAIVNGNPAISYRYYNGTHYRLRFVRATNSTGTAWVTPLTLPGSVGSIQPDIGYTCLTVVNDFPAISFRDLTNGDLRYIRATDISGTAWDAPLTIDATGDVGEWNSLVIVNGSPAVSSKQPMVRVRGSSAFPIASLHFTPQLYR